MGSSKDAAPAAADKFPLQQLAILAICRLGEPIAFMSVVAYIYVYTKDIRHTEDNAAFYAGLLVSAFAVAEVLTAFQWGKISDKYGRKPIVLFALAGTALSNLIFGFATNYWVALASRFLGGALNGNVAVLQTMVAEMCKRPEHEPKAYSMIPFVWSVGSIMGAAMGGYLATPSKTWPWLFPEEGLFGEFPYLLPNVVSVVYLVFTVLVGMVFLKETNDKAVPLFSRKHQSLAPANERTPLLPNAEPSIDGEDLEPDNVRISSVIAPSEPVTVGTTVDIRRLSVVTNEDDKPVITALGTESVDEEALADEEPRHKYSSKILIFVAQLTLMSYHSMGGTSLLPPFLIDEPLRKGLDIHGGLGYTLHDVGGYLAINGMIAMFIQVVIFPPFVERVGVWKSFFWLTIICPVAYVVVPFLTMLSPSSLPFGIYADLALQNFFLIIIYPCLLILLKNATPSMSMLGRVNGLAMAACSGARTVAPPIVGAVYSNGGSAAGWWSVAAAALSAGLLLCYMRQPDHPIDEQSSDDTLC